MSRISVASFNIIVGEKYRNARISVNQMENVILLKQMKTHQNNFRFEV